VGLQLLSEHKASNAAERLQEKVAFQRLREGKEQEVRAKDICVGDILVLNAGDLIPADARIIESKDFFVNQSSLTGEAFPVEKSEADPTAKGDDITSLTNILFSGTSVITGTALAVVTAIGADTEFGKIATELSTAEQDNRCFRCKRV
jgi:Mg2+-importing ATPase